MVAIAKDEEIYMACLPGLKKLAKSQGMMVTESLMEDRELEDNRRRIKKNGGKTYQYYINLDERGEFSADVRDPNGKTVVEFGEGIFEDGFMRNKNDISGLEDYLKSVKIIKSSDRLVKAN
jgi:hypothetical protein